jgi:hypothetical protein
MSFAKVNLKVPRGTAYSRKFAWRIEGELVDLTGCDAIMQVKLTEDVMADPVLEFNATNGRLTLGSSADPTTKGRVFLNLDGSETLAKNFKKAFFDIVIIMSDTSAVKKIGGEFELVQGVTRVA